MPIMLRACGIIGCVFSWMKGIQMDTVLFDMDGTLLETLEDLNASVNYALERSGLPTVSLDETRAAAGYGSIVLIEELTHHAFPTGSEQFKRVFDDFNGHYNENHDVLTHPYDGIMELLSALKERGFKMAIVSNKAQADTEELRQLYFADYIDIAVGRTDDVAPKPAPDMAFIALERLGSTPEQSYYVGDSEPDAQIAKNAGCVGVSCLWGFRTRDVLEKQHPAHLIAHPLELLDIVDAGN